MKDAGDERFEEWWARRGNELRAPKKLLHYVFRCGYVVGRRVMAEETLGWIKGGCDERHP